MKSESDNLPERAWKRFIIGFIVAALFTFAALFLYSGGSMDEFVEAVIVGTVVGGFIGVLSAFGKKWLAFFLELFTQFGL